MLISSKNKHVWFGIIHKHDWHFSYRWYFDFGHGNCANFPVIFVLIILLLICNLISCSPATRNFLYYINVMFFFISGVLELQGIQNNFFVLCIFRNRMRNVINNQNHPIKLHLTLICTYTCTYTCILVVLKWHRESFT